MRVMSYRLVLTLASALLFLGCVAVFRPGLGDAVVASAAGFWIVYMVGTVVMAIVFAIVSVLSGVKPSRIGLKDERDRDTERRAYAVGFWVLFAAGFVAVFGGAANMARVLPVVVVAQVLAIGGILAVGVWDELRLWLVSRGLD